MENQIDEVASMDNSSGDSGSSALLENDLGRCPKLCFLKRAIRRLRSSSSLKFILFKEDPPRHHIIENIGFLHATLAFYLCFFTGLLGFMVLAYASLLGFVAYYALVAVAVLEVLHYLCDR